jgi:transposase-like protein
MDIFTPPVVKDKRPPGRAPKFSTEYQIMIAKSVSEGRMTFREAAKTFGCSHGAINSYVKKYKDQNHKTKRNERASKYKEEVENYRHEAQLKELKHQIAELYLENLMLKKALKHSVQIKRENSSVITSESLEASAEDAE